jgi:glycosyltransferase involved in cell wall biosynthesis
LAAILAILNHKPFIIQTHGMIRRENNAVKKLIDALITVPIMKRAQSNLALSDLERKHLIAISPKLSPIIFRNGISHAFLDLHHNEFSEKRKVIFCSRINEKKRVSIFLEIAQEFSELDQIDFLIFGPDGGELKLVLDKISEYSQKNIATTKYLGPLLTGEVIKVLASVDLLILPSLEDAYPMVILESLSVGTPVLISRYCGNADDVKLIDSDFVCTTDDIDEYVAKIKLILQKYSSGRNREVLRKLSLEFFDIKPVTKSLVEINRVANFERENLANES